MNTLIKIADIPKDPVLMALCLVIAALIESQRDRKWPSD